MLKHSIRAGFQRNKSRAGIGTIIIILALVVIVVVAGVAVFAYVLVGSSSQTSTSSSGSGISTTASSRSTTATSSSTGSTGGSRAIKTYKGTFSYSLRLGPTGERLSSNNSVEMYTSVQVASGSFNFFINPANFSGVGTGQGTITVTTTGFCSGTTSFPYTFRITNANNLLHGNITVAFGNPTPATFMVPLTCTGSLSGVNTATNNPSSFLSVYPNLVSVNSVPATVSQNISGNIIYQYTITPTS